MPVQPASRNFNSLDSGFRRNDTEGAPNSFNEVRINETSDTTEAVINPGSGKEIREEIA
jgi:hypothetical protein